MPLFDPAAAEAWGTKKTELYRWRCPRCRSRLAAVWSTERGMVFSATIDTGSPVDHGVLAAAGVMTHHGGNQWLLQFTDSLAPSETFMAKCPKHGATEIRSSRSYSVYAVPQ